MGASAERGALGMHGRNGGIRCGETLHHRMYGAPYLVVTAAPVIPCPPRSPQRVLSGPATRVYMKLLWWKLSAPAAMTARPTKARAERMVHA